MKLWLWFLVSLAFFFSALSEASQPRRIRPSYLCQALLTKPSMKADSLASEEQVKEIYAWVLRQLGGTTENAQLIGEMNDLLRKHHLPPVNISSADYKLYVSALHGSPGDEAVGIEILDGKHRFCFPCTEGMNNFKFGIVPWNKVERNPNGPFFSLIEAVDRTRGARGNGYVNSQAWTSPRRAIFAIDEKDYKGLLVFYDDHMEFYPAKLPTDKNGIPNEALLQSSSGVEIPVMTRVGFPDLLTITGAKQFRVEGMRMEPWIRERLLKNGPVEQQEIPPSIAFASLLETLHAAALGLRDVAPNADIVYRDTELPREHRCQSLMMYIGLPSQLFSFDAGLAKRFDDYKTQWKSLATEMNCKRLVGK